MKKLSLVLTLVVFAMGFALAQTTVTGKVTDQSGEPLIGASILVKGMSAGTVTDLDGNYTLIVPEGGEALVFSYTGFTSAEVTIGTSTVVDVSLSEGVTLDEAIVTAVGLESNRRTLGYSVENVDGATLVDARETNVINSLSGKVAGVAITSSSGSPGSSANIRIRGATSIGRSNNPLFVIDGVPVDNSEVDNGVGGVDQSNRAIDINPNDIASLTVLKGAAATALYGVRAANGAIIITTKKGMVGKPAVTFSASYALDQVNKLPELQSTYAQGNTRNGVPVWRGPHTGEGNSWGPLISDLEYSTDPNHPNAPPANAFDSEGNYLFDRNGFLVDKGTGNGQPAQAYDAYDFFKTGNTYDVNLSIQGGNESARYFFSAGRLGSQGIVPNAEWERTSVRLNTEVSLTEKLTVGLSGNYINSGGFRVQRGSNVQGIMVGVFRNTPTFDTGNGKIGQDAADDLSSYQLADGSQRSYRAGTYDNPYWVVNKNPTRDDVNRMIGYASLRYEFTPWLSASYKLGLDTYSDRRNAALDLNPRFSGGLNSAGQVTQDAILNRDLNSDLFLQFSHQASEKLGISAVVGQNYFDTRYIRQNTTGLSLGAPDFYHISNATTIQGSETINRKKLMGVYGTLDFNYDDFLFLNLTGRNDWSSALPEDANTFQSYSASVGFAFTELLGLQNTVAFPYGKLRFSYGKVGNDAPMYATANYFGSGFSGGDGFISGISFPAFGVNAFERSTLLGNNQIKPESTNTFEIGGEFKFLRGRIGVDLTYYSAETVDQVISVSIPAPTGFTSFTQNAGKIKNTGIELLLNLGVVRTPTFDWDIDINFTQYENDVIELAEGIQEIGLAGFTSTSSRVVVGQPYGALWGDAFVKNEAGRYLLDANGWLVLDPSKQVLGDPNPDWFGGVRSTFTILNNLRISGLLDIRQGGDMWCGSCGIIDYFGTSQKSAETRTQTVVFDGLLPDGSENNIAVPYWDPAVGAGTAYFFRYGFGGITEMNIFDTSWLRLRELTVAYTISSGLISGFKDLTLSFTGRNLWLNTDYPGIDPETNLTGASNGVGLDYFNVPNTKSYNFAVRATF